MRHLPQTRNWKSLETGNMDLLQKKELDTSRGFRYQYYVSSVEDADTSKPTLLLCHGWPDSAELWQYIIPHLLKTKNRIIAPDLLGAGGTSQPTDPAAFETKAMVQDVNEILKAENVTGKIIPVGRWSSCFTCAENRGAHADTNQDMTGARISLSASTC